MSLRPAFAFMLCALLSASAAAGGLKPLPDAELAKVGGADGVSFAVDLNLNRQNQGQSQGAGESRLVIGQKVDGRDTYIVVGNVGGRVQMFGLNISPKTGSDGTSYLALTLPAYMRFTDTGFDSISVQADPRGPVNESLGKIMLNGEMVMQGQLRLWSH